MAPSLAHAGRKIHERRHENQRLRNLGNDRSSTVVFDFVHISHEGGLYFAEKYNGDVFEMDIDNGSAKFAFWKKT